MTRKLALALAVVVAGTGATLADHNSKWGEGTALDPTGIHDARVDSRDTAGDEPFSETIDAGGGKPFDLFAFMRMSRPATIDIESGSSSTAGASSMDAGSSGHGGSSGNGGGAGNGGGGGRR